MDLLLDSTMTRYQCNLCFSYLQLHKNTKFRHRRCLYLFDSSSYRHPQIDGYYVCLICFEKFQVVADISLHDSSRHHPLTCKQLGFNVDILSRVIDEQSNVMRCLLPFAKDITMGDFNTVCHKNVVWPNGLKNEFLK